MNLGVAVKTCLTQKYATFEGRASRSEFWWFYLFLSLIFLLARFIPPVPFEIGTITLTIPLALILGLIALVLPLVAVGVRRLHDTGMSGDWYFLCLIPLVGQVLLLYLLAQSGYKSTNKYGDSSIPTQSLVTDKVSTTTRLETAIVSSSSQENETRSSATNSIEVIAFRFLLLTWAIGLLIFPYAIYSHFKAEEADKSVSYWNGLITECLSKKNSPDYSERWCLSETALGSPASVQSNYIKSRDSWEERVENSLYLGIAFLVFPALFFYAIRWAITGRLRPLWLLRRN